VTPAARVLSVLLSVGAFTVVGALSQLSVGGPERAIVRLSWRTPAVRIERCRTLTPEELSRLEPHMRHTQECDGRTGDYELRVTFDGGSAHVDTVAPSGLRRDRPVYVFLDLPVEPGDHRVGVDFSLLVPSDLDGAEVGEGLRSLTWTGTLHLEPGRIGLLTLSEDGTELIARE